MHRLRYLDRERIDHPSFWICSQHVFWNTHHVSPQRNTANAPFTHLPPGFLCHLFSYSLPLMYLYTCASTQPFRKSTIFVYWSQTSTEAKIMTDNHIIFAIYCIVMGEELIQLPFPNPQIPNWSCLFLIGIHGGGCCRSHTHLLSYSGSVSFY